MSYDRLRDLKLESRGILGLAVGIISVRHRLTVHLDLSVGAAKKDGTDGGVSNWRDSGNAEERGFQDIVAGKCMPRAVTLFLPLLSSPPHSTFHLHSPPLFHSPTGIVPLPLFLGFSVDCLRPCCNDPTTSAAVLVVYCPG